eukprot:scaffold224124_cov39-Attheya_sp.AAC.1
MAIFPETTSFYRAKSIDVHRFNLHCFRYSCLEAADMEVDTRKYLTYCEGVGSQDDEDDLGQTPHRRVPSRYVIPVPTRYFFEDDDDVDLTPPNSGTTVG